MTSDPTPDAAGSADAAEVIAAALARLRGRRGPLPAGDGPAPHAGPHGYGGPHATPFGPHGFGGPHGGPHGVMHAGPHGGPPWAGGHGRFAGPARLRLLEALTAASGPLSVGEIADRIGVDQPRASRLVQQSVGFGLVRREADPDDARRTRIALTEQGAAIVRRFHGDRRDAVEQALDGFTDAERAELARLLAKLADGWPR